LTPTGAQQIGTESHSRSTMHPDRGRQPTHAYGPMSHCTYKKEERGRGTLDEVHRDLIPVPHLFDRSLRRSSGGKHHTAPPPPQSRRLTPDPGLLPLRRADLLPRARQVSLCRLQRCRARRTSRLVRRANPMALSTSAHHF
jgi:hypothetical protein